MKKLFIIIATLIPLCFGSCKEDALTPSEPQQFGEFPQGNGAKDKEIVAFYEKYGTQVLYKYSEVDFRYGMTSMLPYYSEPAQEAAVADGWKFVKEECLSLWGEEFMKKYLPFRILLADKIYSLKQTWNKDENGNYIYNKIPKGAMYGFNHIAISGINADLANMTLEQKKNLIGETSFALVGYAASKGNIQIPEEFKALYLKNKNNAGGEQPGDWGFNKGAFLEYKEGGQDVEYDFGLYVKYLSTMSPEEFATQFLDDSFDNGGDYDANWNFIPSHPIKAKSEIVLAYFKNKLGIDLGAMGTKISQMK